MMNTMKKMMLTGVLVLAAASIPSVAVAQSGRQTFRVDNQTSYTIEHVYVSPTNYTYWGYDQLGSKVLPPDYYFQVSVVPGWYDVKLVDQDGDSCVVPNVDFRGSDTWTLTDRVLVACELFSRQ